MEGVSGLTSLVSTRIYPAQRPQNSAMPAVSYFKVNTTREYRHGGAAGWANPRFQFDCWAKTYGAAKNVAEQVRLAMNDFTGTFSGVEVKAATAVNEIDVGDPNPVIHHVAVDVQVTHAEAV